MKNILSFILGIFITIIIVNYNNFFKTNITKDKIHECHKYEDTLIIISNDSIDFE